MAVAAISENSHNRHISAAVFAILTKVKNRYISLTPLAFKPPDGVVPLGRSP